MIILADSKRIIAAVSLFGGSALFGQQTQFQGSVPTGVASPTPVTLTLQDAIDRGLRTNLGLVVSGQASESARGERLRSLSALLPQVTGAVSENVQQIDLQTKGINFHIGSFSSPANVGPFDYTDARAYASFSVFDYSLRKSHRAAQEGERAAQLSFKDARDLVVQSVANAYLLVIAGSSRVQALRAQVETDQAIYDRTADQKRAGTAAAIDVLRARVELQQEQQQLIAQENQVAKDKLALGRVIGLPSGQQFAIADTEPYSPLAAMTPDQALRTAYEQRADFQVAVARSNLDLANQTLTQAQDRFESGVTDTIEVVQVQGSVAVANDNLIAALYAHNLAKVELARAWGLPNNGFRNTWR